MMDRARHFRHISAVSATLACKHWGGGGEEAAAAATLYDVWSREAFLWDPIMPPLPRRPHCARARLPDSLPCCCVPLSCLPASLPPIPSFHPVFTAGGMRRRPFLVRVLIKSATQPDCKKDRRYRHEGIQSMLLKFADVNIIVCDISCTSPLSWLVVEPYHICS